MKKGKRTKSLGFGVAKEPKDGSRSNPLLSDEARFNERGREKTKGRRPRLWCCL